MTHVALETARLTLRPPIEADLDAWAALDSDPDATRFIGGLQTREQSRRGMATVTRMWAQRGCSLFSVIERATGNWVGRVGPWVPDGHIGTEIGWAIARTSWGNGYAVEAAAAAIMWAFESLAWTEVIHCIDAPNQPSIDVATRLGSIWMREDRDVGGAIVQVYGQPRARWFAAR
jgi:RimJ/RimL family protein N-acetyltransferase